VKYAAVLESKSPAAIIVMSRNAKAWFSACDIVADYADLAMVSSRLIPDQLK
jgi:hypothetical protein